MCIRDRFGSSLSCLSESVKHVTRRYIHLMVNAVNGDVECCSATNCQATGICVFVRPFLSFFLTFVYLSGLISRSFSLLCTYQALSLVLSHICVSVRPFLSFFLTFVYLSGPFSGSFSHLCTYQALSLVLSHICVSVRPYLSFFLTFVYLSGLISRSFSHLCICQAFSLVPSHICNALLRAGIAWKWGLCSTMIYIVSHCNAPSLTPHTCLPTLYVPFKK